MNIQTSVNNAGTLNIKTGKKDDNISVSIEQDNIVIEDNITHEKQSLPNKNIKEIRIDTGEGNDTIHLSVPSKSAAPIVKIFPGEGNDIVIGGNAADVKKDKNDLVISGDTLKDMDDNIDKIKKFNVETGEKDSTLKAAQRKVVYAFGRDMKFRLPEKDDVKQYADTVKDNISANNDQALNRLHEFGHTVKDIHAGKAELSTDTVKDIAGSIKSDIKANQARDLSQIKDLDAKRNEFKTTKDELDYLKKIARPGDVLLRFQKGYPLDKVLVGTWQHAAIYVKDGNIIDAMGDGTDKRKLDKFGEADGIVLIRLKNTPENKVNKALTYAYEQIGKSYDINFSDNEKAQYCSGLVSRSLKHAGLAPDSFGKDEKGKDGMVKPDLLLALPESEIVWTNRPDLLDGETENEKAYLKKQVK
jgi:uncharacterized protein YycO